MVRLVFLCLTAVLLTSCASLRAYHADVTARHYHGVVLDAKTGTPVGYVSVTAYHQPLGVAYLTPPDYLGFTMTREDGTFDLEFPAANRIVNHLEATSDAPLTNNARPHQGELIGYNGVLNHVSPDRMNTILVREIHAR